MINNATYRRETLSEWPIRQPLNMLMSTWWNDWFYPIKMVNYTIFLVQNYQPFQHSRMSPWFDHGKSRSWFYPGVIYCRVLVKKCPGCLFNSVEIHCKIYSTLIKVMLSIPQHPISMYCGGHWVTQTQFLYTGFDSKHSLWLWYWHFGLWEWPK